MSSQFRIPVYCLHYLGGSARSWADVAQAMGPSAQCIGLDLPGFGEASGEAGQDVAAMADGVIARIARDAPAQWWIAGHSMGAKVALAIARKSETSALLPGLAGLVLLAGSPPAPEPIPAKKREELLSWIDGSDETRKTMARGYIKDNVGSPLKPAAEKQAVTDVLQANPDAWKAWLTQGAREDWRERIGIIKAPSLVLSGAGDEMLGPDAQNSMMLPHLARHRHVTLGRAGHLLPIEQPGAVAKHLRDAITIDNFI